MKVTLRPKKQKITKVTVRPNLHTGKKCKETGEYLTQPESTIHNSRLGTKLDSVYTCTIKCVGVVVQPAGTEKAMKGNKTVHAGVIGFITETIPVNTKIHPRVRYAPHRGDKYFHINGVRYEGGGYVTCLGHEYYLVNN